jgi:hypothetical protein
MRGSLWSGLALSMAASAYTSPQPVAGDGFESWRPGATHLTAAIMAKQHYGSQTFYFDCYQGERPSWVKKLAADPFSDASVN